jgi:hypothetical protein
VSAGAASFPAPDGPAATLGALMPPTVPFSRSRSRRSARAARVARTAGRGALACAAVLAAAAAPAGAAPGDPLALSGPQDGASLTAGTAPPLGAVGVAGDAGLELRVSTSPDTIETVLLHEFGHVAGNPLHVPRGCRDTPMVIGLASGAWWRSTTDYSYRACNTAG